MATGVHNETRNRLSRELEHLFEEHYQLVYRTAYGLTGSVEDAEDVLQTIFTRLLARGAPPDLDDPKPYLYRAAFNLALNTIRDRKRKALQEESSVLEKPHAAPRENIDQRLHEAIARLNPAAAQIVILKYVHNYSLAEIARTIGTTRSTVAVSLFRSRARLKKLLRAAWEDMQ